MWCSPLRFLQGLHIGAEVDVTWATLTTSACLHDFVLSPDHVLALVIVAATETAMVLANTNSVQRGGTRIETMLPHKVSRAR